MDWQTLEKHFRAVRDPYGDLRLDCSTRILDSDDSVEESWRIAAYLDASARAEFEAISRLAATLLTDGTDTRPDRWYREIRQRGLGRAGYPPLREFELREGGKRKGLLHSTTVHDAVTASAALCLMLAAEPSAPTGCAPNQKASGYEPHRFGEVLRQSRRAAGKSQASLAAIVGVTSDTVSRWERGERSPMLENLCELEDFIRENHPDGEAALSRARATPKD